MQILVLIFTLLCSYCCASRFSRLSPSLARLVPRGGDTENDEERYSRQVFTLGARAHQLVRTSTVYLDGPVRSGLMYEVAKNLALSGVQHLVILTSRNPLDNNYHDPDYDDLGNMYIRGARAEIGNEMRFEDLLVEYIRRLNPTVQVSLLDRDSLRQRDNTKQGVLIVIDRPLDTQLELNEVTREKGLCFVSTETAGVYGRVMCDFGHEFEVVDADGEQALVTPLDTIEEEDGMFTVFCIDGERHDVSKGDIIQFIGRDGNPLSFECAVEKIRTPFRFVIKPPKDIADSVWLDQVRKNASSFSRIKVPRKIDFRPLKKVLGDNTAADFTPSDFDKSFDESRRLSVQACFGTLQDFVREKGHSPREEDQDFFLASIDTEAIETTKHVENFCKTCRGKFSPLQAVFGAIVAQEGLKAVTGLYSPVKQILLYDCDEILTPRQPKKSTKEKASSCNGLRYIIGDDQTDSLQRTRIFVVGAGAIGCEILKNLAAMNIGTKGNGRIALTDMDTIEKSNLSRQFLFRDDDIGSFKSEAAQKASRRLCPDMKIESHSSKVGDQGSTPFDANFWQEKVDVVLNALDNIDARLFMDSKCVENGKALIDAGTLGPKGNVQVVVPFKTESYASSVDPPEESIPVCTLKNFPYAISHTIQWGRDLFDGLFRRRADQVNGILEQYDGSNARRLVEDSMREFGEEGGKEFLAEMIEDLNLISMKKSDLTELQQSAIRWAIRLAKVHYAEAIEKLLREHPHDSVDEDGKPFWSGSRRAPQVLKFSDRSVSRQDISVNENLVSFVLNAARLRLESFGVTKQNGLPKSEIEASLREEWGAVESKDGKRAEVEKILETAASGKSARLVPIEFEKDDDSNGHVAFITAASNLRAICYGIPPSNELESRRIAGKIVPAMITTTAFVSALSCIELVKLSQNADAAKYKNAFVNLALPFFAFTPPLPAETIQGLQGRHFTIWDRLVVKEKKKDREKGGLTVKQLLKRVKKVASLDPSSISISSISFGPYMLYADFLHEDNKGLLRSSFWDVVAEAADSSGDEYSGRETEGDSNAIVYSPEQPFVDLTIVVEDLESGEEVELPPVRVIRA